MERQPELYPPLTSAPCKSSTGSNPTPRPSVKASPSTTVRCLRSRVQVLASRYKPKPAVGCMLWQEWSRQGLNAMGKLVADIIVETLQNAGVKHCYGVAVA